MPKWLQAALIGFGVALVVGFGLSAILSGNGEDNTTVVLFNAVVWGAIAAYIFGNLAGNRSIATASDADKEAALARKAPLGKALLYVYREGFVAKLAGLNIAVDGNNMAQLKAPRFTVLTIPAGQHKLTAQFGGLAGAQNKTGELSFDAPAGGTVAVRINMQMGMLKGSVQFTPESDIAAALQKMGAMPMTPPDIAEI